MHVFKRTYTLKIPVTCGKGPKLGFASLLKDKTLHCVDGIPTVHLFSRAFHYTGSQRHVGSPSAPDTSWKYSKQCVTNPQQREVWTKRQCFAPCTPRMRGKHTQNQPPQNAPGVENNRPTRGHLAQSMHPAGHVHKPKRKNPPVS